MPWHISEQDGKYCVVKNDTNETVTCHDTRQQALDHIAALYANVPDATKAGRSISGANMARVQSMHDMACQMGAQCDMGNAAHDYTPIGKSLEELHTDLDAITKAISAQESSKPTTRTETETPSTTAKAGALVFDDDSAWADATIKALGDRTLELRVAWGWDNHREQFHPQLTDFDTENFPTPPVAYYHGYTDKNQPATKPIYIGKTIKRENRADGHYLIAKLNNKPEATRVWNAALKGEAVVSPATAGHLRRKANDGTLTYWPIVEISAWDYAETRKQAHPRSVAFPVLKALYQEAGLSVPSVLISPEAPGDGASASADIPPDEAGRLIVTEVAKALLDLRKEYTP
jgi:hypothetical protein